MPGDIDVTMRQLVLTLLQSHVALYSAVVELTSVTDLSDDRQAAVAKHLEKTESMINHAYSVLEKHNATG